MDLEELKAFIAVADRGSFLAAADELYLSRTTLRRQIDSLEVKAGVPLFRRTRAGVALTEAGAVLWARGRVLVQEAQALLSSVRDVGLEPAGTLSIVVPPGLPVHLLAPLFALVRARIPRVAIRVRISDDPTSELLGDVDIAVSFGIVAPEGPWETRVLMDVQERLVASESYLARHGVPAVIDDLARHTLLSWQAPGGDPKVWTLVDGGTFVVEPALISTDIHLLRLCALSGQGIAFIPDAFVPEAPEASGKARAVLDGVVGRRRQLQLIVPAALGNVPKIQRFVELVDSIIRPLVARVG
jgi:DNA-binding transcriptional LysR family regulator